MLGSLNFYMYISESACQFLYKKSAGILISIAWSLYINLQKIDILITEFSNTKHSSSFSFFYVFNFFISVLLSSVYQT